MPTAKLCETNSDEEVQQEVNKKQDVKPATNKQSVCRRHTIENHPSYSNSNTPQSTNTEQYQHALLNKNNSYPLKSTSSGGVKRKDLLSVPDQFDSFLSYSSSSLCCQAFIEDDQSENDLTIGGREMKSVSVQSLNCQPTVISGHEENGGIEINLQHPPSSSGCQHFRHQQQQRCYHHNAKSHYLKQAFVQKSLKRAKSAPLKSSKEDLQIEDHIKIDHCTSSPSSPPCAEKIRRSRTSIFSPSAWKQSFMKLNDEKSGSRFSLRRTFSLRSTISAYYGVGEGSTQISFPTKKKKIQKYKIVDAKTRQADGISFELINKQGCFLRVKGANLISDRETSSDASFNKDATFVPLKDMWYEAFFAFESVSKPSYFIRMLSEDGLVIDKYDGSVDFKEEASFQLNKKPDANSLKKGVKAWMRTNTGEYCLGKILYVGDLIVNVELNEGKIKRCLLSESFKLVPDVVPVRSDLKVGTRIISKWLHRHTYYAGIVSAVRRGDSYDIVFDDGDKGRAVSFNMRLMKNFPEIDENMKRRNNENHIPNPHQTLKAVYSDPTSREHSDTCSPTIKCLTTVSEPHSRVTSPIIVHLPKRLDISPNKIIFSPYESEAFSQDSGYYENTNNKYTNKNNCSGTSSELSNAQRVCITKKTGVPLMPILISRDIELDFEVGEVQWLTGHWRTQKYCQMHGGGH